MRACCLRFSGCIRLRSHTAADRITSAANSNRDRRDDQIRQPISATYCPNVICIGPPINISGASINKASVSIDPTRTQRELPIRCSNGLPLETMRRPDPTTFSLPWDTALALPARRPVIGAAWPETRIYSVIPTSTASTDDCASPVSARCRSYGGVHALHSTERNSSTPKRG